MSNQNSLNASPIRKVLSLRNSTPQISINSLRIHETSHEIEKILSLNSHSPTSQLFDASNPPSHLSSPRSSHRSSHLSSPLSSHMSSRMSSPRLSMLSTSPSNLSRSTSSRSSTGTPRVTYSSDNTTLHTVLGHGATSRVYRATISLNISGAPRVSLAVKVCQAADTLSKKLVEREIHIATSLNHANVLHLDGYCHLPSKLEYYLYMELCDGTLYETIINTKTPFSCQIIKEYAVQIANSLKYIHTLSDPIIHCDVKSQNFFFQNLADYPVPLLKLGDFGESIYMSQCPKPANVGTTEFSAPEKLSNQSSTPLEYDTKSDIWSFGMVLYELLRKHPPYRTGSYNERNIHDRIMKGNKPHGMGPHELSHDQLSFLPLWDACTKINSSERPTAIEIINMLRDVSSISANKK